MLESASSAGLVKRCLLFGFFALDFLPRQDESIDRLNINFETNLLIAPAGVVFYKKWIDPGVPPPQDRDYYRVALAIAVLWLSKSLLSACFSEVLL